MAKTGKRVFVEGRVQGVWFRGSTREQARRLGITGWAKNLSDGRVEVLMFGDRDAIAVLETWLRQGPELAQVFSLTSQSEEYQALKEFVIY